MTATSMRRGACPALSAPMQTGDGLLARLNPADTALTPKLLAGLAEAASRHGNGIIEITARGNLQFRGLSKASAIALETDVTALGILSRDRLQPETNPLAGLDPSMLADPRPLAEAICTAAKLRDLDGRLAPKFSVVVNGGGAFDLAEISADLRFDAARDADGRTGWIMALAGTASAARPVSFFPDAAAATNAAIDVLDAIAALGADARGRDMLQFFAAATHPGRCRREPQAAIGGRTPLSNGGIAVPLALPFGSTTADRLACFCADAAELGVASVRPVSARRLVVVLDSEADTAHLMAAAARAGLVTRPDDARLFISACPGTPACASGRIAARRLAKTFATLHGPLLGPGRQLHVSGCRKGCAHPARAPFTIVGDDHGVGIVVNGTAHDPARAYIRDAQEALDRVAALIQALDPAGPDRTKAISSGGGGGGARQAREKA